MRFEYGTGNVAQGRQVQQRQQETPATFGRENSADVFNNAPQMDKPRNRMAGQRGERLLSYLTDMKEQQRTNEWNNAFSQSNEGVQFNMAKMNGGMPPEEGGMA